MINNIEESLDESNKKGLRIVIECNKGVNLDSIAQKLYAKTNLQTSISYNQVALIDKTPGMLIVSTASTLQQVFLSPFSMPFK